MQNRLYLLSASNAIDSFCVLLVLFSVVCIPLVERNKRSPMVISDNFNEKNVRSVSAETA